MDHNKYFTSGNWQYTPFWSILLLICICNDFFLFDIFLFVAASTTYYTFNCNLYLLIFASFP